MKPRLDFDVMTDLVLSGDSLTAREAARLEASLLKAPDDEAVRLKLLGFYFARMFDSKRIGERRQKHVLWVIEKFFETEFLCKQTFAVVLKSDAPEYYNQAAALWLALLAGRPSSSQGWLNLAFWASFSDVNLAKAALANAGMLDPHNPHIEPVRLRIDNSRHLRSVGE